MPTMPEKPTILFEKRMFLAILNDKMSHTYNDAEKKLFKAMIAMTQFIDDSTIDKQFYFGTEHFETVWEKLIDITFGIKNKEDYFPRTNWKGRIGEMRAVPKHALEPDSINVKVRPLGTMIPNEKIFHSPYPCEILFIPNWDKDRSRITTRKKGTHR